MERGREMYSASLCKEEVLKMKKRMKPYSRKITRSLERVNRHLLEWKKECEGYQILDSVGSLPVVLMNLMEEMESFLEEPPDPDLEKKFWSFIFRFAIF